MKPFIPYKNEKLYRPNDTLKIIQYLKERGEIKVTPKTIERLYEEFSDDRYCAGWMGIDAKIERYNFDDELEEISILDEFIEWLEEIDI